MKKSADVGRTDVGRPAHLIVVVLKNTEACALINYSLHAAVACVKRESKHEREKESSAHKRTAGGARPLGLEGFELFGR